MICNESYYTIQASSKAGSGPLSLPFTGKTLKFPGTNLLWADMTNIHAVDVFGENGHTYIHSSMNSIVNNIAWMNRHDKHVWSSDGTVFTIEADNQPSEILADISTIESVVYENLGDQLYYSVQGRPEIIQAALEDSTKHTIDTGTIARNLMVDSLLAKLCWISFLNELKCSNLDGSNQSVIHSVGIYGDERLYSAALDPQTHTIYLIIYNIIGSPRYEYLTINIVDNMKGTTVGLPFTHLEPNIYFLSGKLFFSQNHDSIITYELAGKSKASSLLASRSLSFTLAADEKALFPESFQGMKTVTAIPDSIDQHSIYISGPEDSYTLAWNSVNTTNFGNLKYEVVLLSQRFVVDEPSLFLSEITKLQPFQQVNVSISAFTEYARSKPSKVSVHTTETRNSIYIPIILFCLL